MGFLPRSGDPFYHLTAPPPNETPAQKLVRQRRELEAQRINDQIEEDIRRHKALLKKEVGVIQVLLVGQAESGKSTTLKNFRMRYAREEWERERDGWRIVVQFNLIKSINTILRVVEQELNGEYHTNEEDEISIESRSDREPVGLDDRHRMLMIRLAALGSIERELKRRLGAASEDNQPAAHSLPYNDDLDDIPRRPRITELAVRSWGDVLLRRGRSSLSSDDISDTLVGCKADMIALWNDEGVKRALEKRDIQMSDTSGFFLTDLDRIASRDYTVTDDDIVRARLRTLGVQEYVLTFPQGPWDSPRFRKGWKWRIFDVGGCRTVRMSWLPHFENVDVIIFLSPVSVFDQKLDEDPKINRLEDSFAIWTDLCSTRLLEKTQLILFMNKVDLLKKKLKRGVRLVDYVPSYRGKGDNDARSFIRYVRAKFKEILKEKSPLPEARHTYIYPTSVIETAETGVTLETVRDSMFRVNLASSQLI